MSEIYPMIPAASKSVVFLLCIGALLMVIGGGLGLVTYAARATQFELDGEGLSIRGDPFFGRTLAWDDLDYAAAQVIDLAHDRQYQVKIRTLGTGLPGYAAGWFRLVSGEKALAFITGGTRAVRVPTHRGWSLLMTVPDPDAMVARLQRGASG